mmetsp:Transcript_14371/g.38140  ORF Transcript_14371/g.38140 Transcript_14371/m.38140 type:complete len:107 (-) Transcript_14371:2251-2571(-)
MRSSEFEKNLKIDGHRVSQLRCGSAPPHGNRFDERDTQFVESDKKKVSSARVSAGAPGRGVQPARLGAPVPAVLRGGPREVAAAYHGEARDMPLGAGLCVRWLVVP